MNRPLFALLCAAAALSGWGGMSFWRGMDTGPAGKPPAHSPAAGATDAGGFARPAGKAANPGSPGAVEALALARALDPADEESLSKLKALPPGSARDLALALFESRARAAGLPVGDGEKAAEFNPFADVPEDATSPSRPTMEQTIKRLLAGEPLEEFADDALKAERAPFTGGGEPLIALDSITYWAGLDPAAASETILKMPPGKSRTAAVDAAAKVMSRDNPQAAWDLVLKSGEQKLGEGAALAWLAKVGQHAETNKQLAAGLSPAQQENMAKALGDLMDSKAGGGLSDKEVSLLACGVPSLTRGPAQEKLLAAIAERQPMFLYWATGGAKYFRPDEPAHVLVAAQMMIERVQTDPLGVVEQITGADPESAAAPIELNATTARILPALIAGGHLDTAVSPAVLNAAAPRLLPQLAKAGYVREAAQLLPRITAPEAQRTALESILPQWMDADPAAARAAFNAAPFTALERERWQRHPAFLLNPETGK